MAQNRIIEQLIEEMREYIESCKTKGVNRNQVIVVKDVVLEILDDMSLKIPEEVKKCAQIAARRDQIIAEAEEKAARIVEEGRRQAEALIQESEIMRQAYAQANSVVEGANQKAQALMESAKYEAEMVSLGAFRYTNEMLSMMENIMASTYQETKDRTDAMLRTMEENLKMVQENRRELNEDVAPQGAEGDEEEEQVQSTQSFRDSDFEE